MKVLSGCGGQAVQNISFKFKQKLTLRPRFESRLGQICIWYSGDPKTGRVRFSNGRPWFGFRMVRFSNGLDQPRPFLFFIYIKQSRLIYHSKTELFVRFSNGTISLDHFINKKIFFMFKKRSRLIYHSKTGLKCPVFKQSRHHLKTDLQNVRFSNDSGFRMVGFRIPTVLHYVRILRLGLKAENVQLRIYKIFKLVVERLITYRMLV